MLNSHVPITWLQRHQPKGRGILAGPTHRPFLNVRKHVLGITLCHL